MRRQWLHRSSRHFLHSEGFEVAQAQCASQDAATLFSRHFGSFPSHLVESQQSRCYVFELERWGVGGSRQWNDFFLLVSPRRADWRVVTLLHEKILLSKIIMSPLRRGSELKTRWLVDWFKRMASPPDRQTYSSIQHTCEYAFREWPRLEREQEYTRIPKRREASLPCTKFCTFEMYIR